MEIVSSESTAQLVVVGAIDVLGAIMKLSHTLLKLHNPLLEEFMVASCTNDEYAVVQLQALGSWVEVFHPKISDSCLIVRLLLEALALDSTCFWSEAIPTRKMEHHNTSKWIMALLTSMHQIIEKEQVKDPTIHLCSISFALSNFLEPESLPLNILKSVFSDQPQLIMRVLLKLSSLDPDRVPADIVTLALDAILCKIAKDDGLLNTQV